MEQPMSPHENNPLTGKSVVISGATSGIGWQAALQFAQHGALVIALGRSAERAQTAQSRILSQVPQARLHFVLADFNSLAEVRRAADDIRQILSQAGCAGLDVLINNAGAFNATKQYSEDGFERTFAVNHLAAFQLTMSLLPELRASGDGRVMAVSSYSHRTTCINPRHIADPRIYNSLWAYKSSKLCNVLFCAEFNRRFGGEDLRAFAVDPGLVDTDIAAKHSGALIRLVWRFRRQHGTHAHVPVQNLLYLAQAELDNLPPAVYWRDSQPRKESRQARRADQAREIWELSLRCCEMKEESHR
jgi:NAD(P)-dependent dehydrogenase (short-subunit alcohol dehydrogenase family)